VLSTSLSYAVIFIGFAIATSAARGNSEFGGAGAVAG
jgi:hypothetical protein